MFGMEKGIIFMGTPEFALPVLRSLIESPYHVLAAYTQPDKSAGRGQRVGLSPVKRLAMEYEIPVIQPQTLKSAEVMQGLADFAPDLIVVAAFGHILPAQVLSLPRFACLNIHPSLLPAHRGPSPIADAILCGDPITGVTIILMDEGMDTGPIVAQREMDISDGDNTGSLAQKLSHTGAHLLLETLPGWFDGRFEPQPQDEARASYSTLLTNKDS
ncbi:MAG: methionyl-tRNA formyltransferase, partial [Chloroflexota bacterium]|nr:methionyl-tRNA formyltransferase [Chloroflexota bacterium]